MRARELLDLVLDDGTFVSWDTPIDGYADLDPTYAVQLERARKRSGADEAVLTGAGSIQGHEVAAVVGEFSFLGGSIGRATAARIVAAVERATRQRLPLLVTTASSGTRMQEGTPAFVEMISISRVVARHKAAGLPYLVYLRDPTFGGVLASWGSLGHVTVAEPGAKIGFLGPRVAEELSGSRYPRGVQLAEHLVTRGVIDGVVRTDELAELAGRVLRLLQPPALADPPAASGVAERPAGPGPPSGSAWDSVLLTRRDDRPGLRELLRLGADDVVPLSGTGDGERDAGMRLALTAFDGIGCVLVGQDRRRQTEHALGPAALRAARRGMRLAQELRLPLVTVVDTPGADLSPQAEEGALAGEIARCIADMSQLTVPTVAVLLGQGSGGGALALLAAQRVVAAEHAWLAPLPPEGASVIVHRDTAHAPQLATQQRVRAHELHADGIVHVVVPERPVAHEDPVRFVHAMVAATTAAIRDQLTRR